MSNEPPPISGMGSEPPQGPVRVEPIGYYNPSQFVHRPGILTALAIVSIIVAGLGLLLSCSSVFSTAMVSRMKFPVVGAPGATMTVGSGSGAGMTSGGAPGTVQYSNGAPAMLTAPNRDLAVSAFNEVSPLSQPRQKMLAQLLETAGDDPFPFAESNFSIAKIRAAISGFGPVPGDPSKQYFITPTGRIEVADDGAIFMSTQGKTVAVGQLAQSAPTTSLPPTSAPAFVMTSMNVGTSTMAMMIGVSIANLLLAGFLLYIAIRALQDYPRSRVLYLRFAVLKFAMIVVGGVLTWIWTQELYGQMSAGLLNSSWIAAASVVLNSLFAAILPTAILIVMSTRSIKAYYGSRITELQEIGR